MKQTSCSLSKKATNFVNAGWCCACSAFSLRILSHHNCFILPWMSQHRRAWTVELLHPHLGVVAGTHQRALTGIQRSGRWLRSRSSTLLWADGKQSLSGQTRGSPSSGKPHVTFLDFSTFSIRPRQLDWLHNFSPFSGLRQAHTHTRTHTHTHGLRRQQLPLLSKERDCLHSPQVSRNWGALPGWWRSENL